MTNAGPDFAQTSLIFSLWNTLGILQQQDIIPAEVLHC